MDKLLLNLKWFVDRGKDYDSTAFAKAKTKFGIKFDFTDLEENLVEYVDKNREDLIVKQFLQYFDSVYRITRKKRTFYWERIKSSRGNARSS